MSGLRLLGYVSAHHQKVLRMQSDNINSVPFSGEHGSKQGKQTCLDISDESPTDWKRSD